MRGRLLFSLLILLSMGAGTFLYLRSNQNAATPETSKDTTHADSNLFSRAHEYWVAELSGFRNHKSCKGRIPVKLTLQFLFPPTLANTLKHPPSDTPVKIEGSATIEGAELGGTLEPILLQQLKVSAAWMKSSSGTGTLQLVLDSNDPILPGTCNKGPSEPRRHLKLNTMKFENNTLVGHWTTDQGASEGGSFTMQWASGGPSTFNIAGPLAPSAVGASTNVTVKWRPFPGAELYRVYTFKTTPVTAENIHKVNEVKTNFAIVTDLTNGVPYIFAVATVIKGLESPISAQVVARPGVPLRAKQIHLGRQHACIVTMDDSVRCWGGNDVGQAGQPKAPWVFPTTVANAYPTKDLRVEGDRTCAQLTNGQDLCWGSPTGISGTAQEKLKCAQQTNGKIECDGHPLLEGTKLRPGTLSFGQNFACVLSEEQNVFCWGANALGQLGNGSGEFSQIPVLALD